ncbi:MAG TPA: hypothetical protein VFO01_19585 [Trebonia sp.]|nr:hypothetical protein [Trebonia sp.]
MTVATTRHQPTTDERLDQLAAQLQEVSDELRRQREGRERWAELAGDVAPLAGDAMSAAIRYLDADASEFADVASLAHALARNASVLEAWLGPLRSMAALADEAGPLATPAVASLTSRLQQLDERGYFDFARQTAGVLDNVVTSFTEEDVRLLGQNIVLILQTVRQMTQPEVMNLLGRTATGISESETAGGPAGPPPSTLTLIRQMHDPLVRRGLARLLATLRTIGAQPASTGPQPAGTSQQARKE